MPGSGAATFGTNVARDRDANDLACDGNESALTCACDEGANALTCACDEGSNALTCACDEFASPFAWHVMEEQALKLLNIKSYHE